MERRGDTQRGRLARWGATFAAALLVAALASSAAALASSSPAGDVYHKAGTTIQHSLGALKPPKAPTTTTTPTSTTSSAPAQQLPFTGLDLGLVVAAGLVLVALGFSLRRLTRKPPAAS